MYQNKYPKMIISIGIYSINRPEAGYGRGGCICVCMSMYKRIYTNMTCVCIYKYGLGYTPPPCISALVSRKTGEYPPPAFRHS